MHQKPLCNERVILRYTASEKMDEYPVYLNRPWMNYSTNAFSGWTITVTAATGGIIVAALALLVQMAGEAAWTVAAFTMHQYRATDLPETGLFRQTQVILRNPSTSLAASLQLLKTGWKWHRVVHKARRRTAPLAVWPLLFFICFITAGLSVSQVTRPAYGTNQVLLRSTNCGLQNWLDPVDNQDLFSQMGINWADGIRQSRAYATECYNNPNKTLGCTSLPVQELPFTMVMNASCPLPPRCLDTIHFDTGLLDSHKHLGINAKDSDRVNFQMTTTCAPIDIIDTYEDVPDTLMDGEAAAFYFRRRTYLGTYGDFAYTFELPTIQRVLQIPYTVQ